MDISFDVMNKYCPSHNVLSGISDKWSILIISSLSKRSYRFGELKRQIGGISQKVLSQNLQKLEKFNLINRQDFNELPLRVEYTLTDLGKELSNILNRLTDWTEQNMELLLSEKLIHVKP